jgi:hypothetical protein
VGCRECGVSENSSSKIRSVQALIQQHRRRLNGSIKTLPGHALREVPQTVWTLSLSITQSTCADVDRLIPSWDVESQIRVKSHVWRHLIDISARPRLHCSKHSYGHRKHHRPDLCFLSRRSRKRKQPDKIDSKELIFLASRITHSQSFVTYLFLIPPKAAA